MSSPPKVIVISFHWSLACSEATAEILSLLIKGSKLETAAEKMQLLITDLVLL